MYARTAAFDAAIRHGGTVVSTIDAFRRGERVAHDIPWVKPSTVTVDEGAASWRTCEVTVADIDGDLIPRTPESALGPYGTDLFIRTGFRYADGSVEQMPMGVYRLLTARPTRQGLITLLGYDYSMVVARARFENPRVFPRGFSRLRAIGDLIRERTSPQVVINYEVDDASPLPLTVFEEGERFGSPWKACMDMAEAGGLQVFFSPEGPYPHVTIRSRPIVTEGEPAAWTFRDGEGSTKVDFKPEADTTNGYNVYVVSGESSELASDGLAPVRASAEITDPSSPLYPPVYGRVPIFLASSFIRTTAQALAVAKANLPLKAGGTRSLPITAFPHPAHEAGDTVRAVDEYLGEDGRWLLSRFPIPLGLDEVVTYACRPKTVV